MEREILDHFHETLGQELKRDSFRTHKVMNLKMERDIPFLTFPKLSDCSKVTHLFSIRAGGVSKDQFTSMNFSTKLGDAPEHVKENYQRIASIMGSGLEDMVGTVQTHTTNIRLVTKKDRGKGILYPCDYADVDGLVTAEKGITLCAYGADCVVLFFVDPVREVIGIAHSGWRGTVSDMAGRMVHRLNGEFGSKPEDLLVGIAPSICRDCYEVDEVVADQFKKVFGDAKEECLAIASKGIYPIIQSDGMRRVVENGRQPGKYQLDLWLANMILLVRAGLSPEKIDVTDLCTACNPGVLFSHRASHGKRGNLGGFLKLN